MSKAELRLRFFQALFSILVLILGVILFQSNDRLTLLFANTYHAAGSTTISSSDRAHIAWSAEQNKLKSNLPEYNVISNKLATSDSVPVLLYHGIGDGPDSITTSAFIDQLYALKKDGWSTVSITDFNTFIQGQMQLPEKSFLLTFDDGRKDSYYRSDPVLEKLDFSAVMFVITGADIKNNYYLTLKEYQKMLATNRWELQSHSRAGHDFISINRFEDKAYFLTNKLWYEPAGERETNAQYQERIESDLLGAITDFENMFGYRPQYFAYPFGDYGQNSINFIKAKEILPESVKKLYQLGFNQVWLNGEFYNNYPNNTGFAKRIEVNSNWSGDQLVSLLAESSAKTPPFTDDFTVNHGWLVPWGEAQVGSSRLLLKSKFHESGAMAILNGSGHWQNYALNATAQLNQGDSFSLILRYFDQNNYYSCVYSDQSVAIRKVINGENELMHTVSGEFFPKNQTALASAAILGDTISCSWFNNLAANYTFKPEDQIPNGGIGFKVWGEYTPSELIITDLKVKPL